MNKQISSEQKKKKKTLCQKSYQRGKWLCKYSSNIQTAETLQELVNNSKTIRPSVTKLM